MTTKSASLMFRVSISNNAGSGRECAHEPLTCLTRIGTREAKAFFGLRIADGSRSLALPLMRFPLRALQCLTLELLLDTLRPATETLGQ